MKEYLVSSKYNSYYGTGFQCVEVVNEHDYKKLLEIREEKFSFYVYEWEGKHSENKVTLDDNDFALISEDQECIQNFKSMYGSYIGTFSFANYVMELYDETSYYEDVKRQADEQDSEHEEEFIGE